MPKILKLKLIIRQHKHTKNTHVRTSSVMGRDIDEVVWLNERDEARLGVEPFLSKSMLVHFLCVNAFCFSCCCLCEELIESHHSNGM